MTRTLALLALVVSACGGSDAPQRLLLGSTHTLEDSGVLDTLVAAFQAEHPEYTLASVIGSSGEVLTMAERGDFDVIFTHSPDDEATFIAAGHGTDRKIVMHNDFVILGPPNDSAGVKAMSDAAAAIARIKEAGAIFVSRGDDSGTHRKELQLWKAAQTDPVWDGYVEAGTGMADALRLASQRRAYILADRATFEVLRDQLDLDIVHEGDPRLLNQYSVTIMTRATNADGARAFSDWMTAPAAQSIIAEFGKQKTGKPLFIPDALILVIVLIILGTAIAIGRFFKFTSIQWIWTIAGIGIALFVIWGLVIVFVIGPEMNRAVVPWK